MFNKERTPNFEANPVVKVSDINSLLGYDLIVDEISNAIEVKKKENGKICVVIDCYHGVGQEEIFDNLVSKLDADLIINSEQAKYPEKIIFDKFKKFIVPEDRTYGVFSVGDITEFFNNDDVIRLREEIDHTDGVTVIYGVGASIIHCGDILIYGNIARQEIKDRYRKGLDNWGAENYDEEPLKKDKRGTFLEWRMMDKHKRSLFDKLDYMIDFNIPMKPVLISADGYRNAIIQVSKRPFSPVPIFIKSIWGGKWIQKVLGVHQDWENVGWGMTGILDYQSIKLQCGGNIVEIPCMDLIYYKPKQFLGKKTYYTWGYKCPLHINFLDTWHGGNLSLQVHPLTSYAFDVFNSSYGHHESYYILDSSDHSSVYLGLKEGIKVSNMVEELLEAQKGTEIFDDSKYVNNIPVKKHDHVFIPSGTVHASGEGTLVLEIDAFCFATFKLWDWGRVDYDGKPRPINIDHGQYNIEEDFQGEWVYDNLVAKQPLVEK